MYKKNIYPGVRQSISLVVICLLLQVVAGGVIGIFLQFSSAPSRNISPLVFISSTACTLFTAAFGIYRSKVSIKRYFSLKSQNRFTILLCIAFFLGTYFLVFILSGFMQSLFHFNDNLGEIYISGFGDCLSILAIVVIAPIFEETLFRGVILRGLLKNYGVLKALIVTSVLFGILHFNIAQLITASILGLMLGFIFIKTGSLILCILFHALNNGLSIIIYELSSKYKSMFSSAYIIIIPVLLIAAGTVSLYFLIRKPDNISDIIEERNAFLSYEESMNIEYADMPAILYRHSGMGISSFAIFLVSGLIDMSCIAYLTVPSFNAIQAPNMNTTMFIANSFILTRFLNLIGLGLGIASLIQKYRKKTFPILGTVLNSFAILFSITLLLTGIIAKIRTYQCL
ncbi:MAG: type II CAAX endopeptidase family protein [Clostridiales bacterium]|nr:type II CAAX endopeptidase family protein [Clostridiales bacterium]